MNQITIMIGILFVIAANFISIPNSANRYSSDGKYLTGISRLKEEIAINSRELDLAIIIIYNNFVKTIPKYIVVTEYASQRF